MEWHNSAKTRVALVLVVALGVCGLAEATTIVKGTYYTVPIPNFSGGGGPGQVAGGYPEVEGYDVVWTGLVGGPPPAGGPEIFHFNGGTSTQLTTRPAGAYGNYGPFISSLNRIPYAGNVGATNEVFFLDMGAGTTTQLTATSQFFCMVVRDFHDHYLTPRVVWDSSDQWLGGPYIPTWMDVDFWDGTYDALGNPVVIALNPRLYNYGPQVGQYNVVWHSAPVLAANHDIFLYNIPSKTTTQMTSRAGWSFRDPQLSEPYVVWWGGDGLTGTQIILCDLNQGLFYRHTVASSSLVKWPYLSNTHKYVVWSWADDILPHDNVYYHDHSPPFPLTTQIYPTRPEHLLGTVDCISASYPYAAFSVSQLAGPVGPYEIYLHDLVNLGTVQRIAMGSTTTPVFVRLSTKLWPPYGYVPVVVWETDFGGVANQAFMATRPACSPKPRADFNSDCAVTAWDLAYMMARWGQPNTPADIDGNGTVGMGDFAILTNEWLNCNVEPPIWRWQGLTFP